MNMTEAKSDVSLSEAVELLTVGEVRAIEAHYGKSLDGGKLSGTDLTVGVVWALERRRWLSQTAGPDREAKKPDWSTFDSWTMRQLNGYFPDEEVEVDPADPETAEGKGATLDA